MVVNISRSQFSWDETVFPFKESLTTPLISGVASSQNRLYNGGTIPDVTIIFDFRFLSDRGRGHPEIVRILLSSFAKVQQILSRKFIIIAVANPMCTGVPINKRIRFEDILTYVIHIIPYGASSKKRVCFVLPAGETILTKLDVMHNQVYLFNIVVLCFGHGTFYCLAHQGINGFTFSRAFHDCE